MLVPMTDETEFQTPRMAVVAGVIAVGVIFLFLHTFGGQVLAQLGEEITGSDEVWRYRGLSTLTVMGGVLGALVAAMRFRLETWQTNLGWSFRACSVAAVFAVVAQSWTGLLGAAFVMGAASGWVLTTLATGMRASVGTRRLGFVVGGGLTLSLVLGEGSFILAELFGDSTRGAAIVVAMLSAATSVVVPFLTPLEPSMDMTEDYRGRALGATWVALFSVGVIGNLYTSALGSGIEGVLPFLIGVGILPLLGRLIDSGYRKIQLIAAGIFVVGGTFGLDSMGHAFTMIALAVLWIALLAFYFAARSGRVWIAAGTVTLVWFVAPYVGSLLGS